MSTIFKHSSSFLSNPKEGEYEAIIISLPT
jgi:hypothetical protein